MRCRFETIAAGLHACTACGQRVRSSHPPERIHARCSAGGATADYFGGNIEPAERLAADVMAFVVNGQAGVQASEIESRLAVCRGCEHFLGDNCRHYATGCHLERAFLWALVGWQGKQTLRCPQWPDEGQRSKVQGSKGTP